MTLTFSDFGLSNLMALLRGSDAPQPSVRSRPETLSESATDEVEADRAFARDMMTRNPEAFQSEHGMMMLMSLYSKHF